MGVQGRRPQRGADDRFSEPPLITDVDSILRTAVENGYIDGNGNIDLEEIASLNGIELVYEDLPSSESGYFTKVGTHCKIGVNIKHNTKYGISVDNFCG